MTVDAISLHPLSTRAPEIVHQGRSHNVGCKSVAGQVVWSDIGANVLDPSARRDGL